MVWEPPLSGSEVLKGAPGGGGGALPPHVHGRMVWALQCTPDGALAFDVVEQDIAACH